MAGLRFLARGIPGMKEQCFPPKKGREEEKSELIYYFFFFCT
jgi:hypothetical protein